MKKQLRRLISTQLLQTSIKIVCRLMSLTMYAKSWRKITIWHCILSLFILGVVYYNKHFLSSLCRCTKCQHVRDCTTKQVRLHPNNNRTQYSYTLRCVCVFDRRLSKFVWASKFVSVLVSFPRLIQSLYLHLWSTICQEVCCVELQLEMLYFLKKKLMLVSQWPEHVMSSSLLAV